MVMSSQNKDLSEWGISLVSCGQKWMWRELLLRTWVSSDVENDRWARHRTNKRIQLRVFTVLPKRARIKHHQPDKCHQTSGHEQIRISRQCRNLSACEH